MNYKIALLLIISSLKFGFAQPVFNRSNLIECDTLFRVKEALINDQIKSILEIDGPNVVWDFSNVQNSEYSNNNEIGLQITSSNTGSTYYSSRPRIGRNYTYYTIDDTSFAYAGYNIITCGATFDDPGILFKFPFRFNNCSEDTLKIHNNSCNNAEDIKVTSCYNSYGRLLINGRSYENVIKIESTNIKLYGLDTTVIFYSSNPIFPLLKYVKGASTFDYIFFEHTTLGLKNPSSSLISGLHPNPATDVLQIDNIKSALDKVMILNSSGEEYSSSVQLNKENQSLNVSNLKPGFYYLKLYAGSEVQIRSFVKQ